MGMHARNRVMPRARRMGVLGGALLVALGLALDLLGGCASGPEGPALRMPGTPVDQPYRGRDAVGRWGEVDVNVGAQRPAYVYTPDHRFALVANGPERAAEDLNPQAGSWEVTCFAQGPGERCRLVALGEEKQNGRRVVAVTITFDPQGEGTTLCVGPPGAADTAVRVGEHGEWRAAGVGGCFPPGRSGPLLAELKAANQLGYRYGSAGASIAGWRPAYGLGEALDLMQWMYNRVTAA